MRPDIDAVRARAEAATNAPWVAVNSQHWPHGGMRTVYGPLANRYIWCGTNPQDFRRGKKVATITASGNAAVVNGISSFIAAARTDVIDLLDYIAELEAKIGKSPSAAEAMQRCEAVKKLVEAAERVKDAGGPCSCGSGYPEYVCIRCAILAALAPFTPDTEENQ